MKRNVLPTPETRPKSKRLGDGAGAVSNVQSNRRRVKHTAISVPKETPGTERTTALKYLQDLVTHTPHATGTSLRVTGLLWNNVLAVMIAKNLT